ncbi:MAG: S1C family serine protease, partial [Planctomycetaceae bacterium]
MKSADRSPMRTGEACRPGWLWSALLVLASLPLPAVPVSAADAESGSSTAAVSVELTDAETAVLEKAVPETVEDLRVIESITQRLAEKIAPVTVGLSIGRAQGSGVIISEDGYVLTAAHVSGPPGRKVSIILHDGRKVEGVTLGLNPVIDAGMIQITTEGDWPHAEMADADDVAVGDWCVATGHPGGYQDDRSAVLRLGRVVSLGENVIQTDCTLVGGDSGGPLFDMQGRVIGINSRIGVNTDWNFHVPVAAYHDGWDKLIASEEWSERVPGAILGVNGEDHEKGCRVTRVAPGYPAEEAGLQEG